MNVNIREMTLEDADAAAELEKLCFSLPWSGQMIRDEIQNAGALYFAALSGENFLGYCGMRVVLDEGYITNVAVHPDCRRQGVAKALIGALLECAIKEKLSFITLEVRESNNAAIALYGSFGFVLAGRRKGYYLRPSEDALLMTRYL